VERLVAAARRLAEPDDPIGVEARAVLPLSTGLSREGVELALSRCLETRPSAAELAALVASARPAPRAHVLLSANVFVAAHRALAVALASSADVTVRPSRREPEMVRLLRLGAPELFRVAERLDPAPGDRFFAYGTDETLETVERGLPKGVAFEGHGAGLGIVFVDGLGVPGDEIERVASAIAEDVVPFDQRGCLSPRIAFVDADEPTARRLASAIASRLSELEREVPLGYLEPDEVALAVRYRDTMTMVGEVLRAGSGSVGLSLEEGAIVVPPPGRNLHVQRCSDLARVGAALSSRVTSVGVAGRASVIERVRALFPGARLARAGAMQAPPFDGPVDLRGRPPV
jgi:hypothetical protein